MEITQYDERFKLQTKTYLSKYEPYLTHACTFNIKQEVNGRTITAEYAWMKWQAFCANLNKSIYGAQGRKGKQSLIILPILEGELSQKNLHFHCAIGCAERSYEFDELKAIIDTAWRKQPFRFNSAYIVPYRDYGWIDYISKEKKRLDINIVDLFQCKFPADSQMK